MQIKCMWIVRLESGNSEAGIAKAINLIVNDIFTADMDFAKCRLLF